LFTRTDVDHESAALRARTHQRVDGVVDEQEISGLATISHEAWLLSL